MNHKFLDILKKQLGAKCTFLSYSKEKIKSEEEVWELKDCLLVNFTNTIKGRDKIRIPLPKTFNSLTIEDWSFIYNELVEIRDGKRG